MAMFVHQQNGHGEATDGKSTQRIEIFSKAEKKALKVSSQDVEPSADVARKKSGGQVAPPKMQTRSRSNGPSPASNLLYETDASGADRTSTIGSRDQDQGPGRRASAGAKNLRRRTSDPEDDYEDHYDVDRDDRPPTRAGREQRALGPGQADPSAAHGLPHIDGDTYPDTTSGRLSKADMDEPVQPHNARYAQREEAPKALISIPARGDRPHGGVRGSAPSQANTPLQQVSLQSQAAALQPERPPNVTDVMSIAPAGFAFGPPKTAPLDNNRSIPRPQPPGAQPFGQELHKETPSDVTTRAQQLKLAAHQQPLPAREQYYHSPRQPSQRLAPPNTRRPDHGKPTQYGPSESQPPGPPKDRLQPQRSRHGTPMQQSLETPSELDQQYSEGQTARQGDSDMSEPHEEQYPADDQNQLDYSLPQLFDMSFQDLRSRPFDSDPNASPFALPDGQEAVSLEQKLHAAVSLPTSMQIELFGSLGFQQWEEAGDWFLERFGELAAEFKKARTAKRGVARAFEDEIAQRHDAVSKKRTLTESAMNAMKESGGKVLLSTPKKTKKTK